VQQARGAGSKTGLERSQSHWKDAMVTETAAPANPRRCAGRVNPV
jgi:hypothetical protein